LSTAEERDQWKQAAAMAAMAHIAPGMWLGLGSGSTVAHIIRALAQRLHGGLALAGVVTASSESEHLAAQLGIPLTTLDAQPTLDLALDGADEVDQHLSLIKGGGGAHARERVVIAAAQRFILVADESKLVSRLGTTFPLPVEVLLFARTPVRLHLERMGLAVTLRERDGQPYHTDNGNLIYDCRFATGIDDASRWAVTLRAIPGVVDTGLFIGTTQHAIIAGANGIRTLGAMA